MKVYSIYLSFRQSCCHGDCKRRVGPYDWLCCSRWVQLSVTQVYRLLDPNVVTLRESHQAKACTAIAAVLESEKVMSPAN